MTKGLVVSGLPVSPALGRVGSLETILPISTKSTQSAPMGFLDSFCHLDARFLRALKGREKQKEEVELLRRRRMPEERAGI